MRSPLSLAALHIGAEWTSPRDRTFIGRLALAAFTVALAAFGGAIAPLAFAGLVAAAVLAQLLLEAVTPNRVQRPFGTHRSQRW